MKVKSARLTSISRWLEYNQETVCFVVHFVCTVVLAYELSARLRKVTHCAYGAAIINSSEDQDNHLPTSHVKLNAFALQILPTRTITCYQAI